MFVHIYPKVRMPLQDACALAKSIKMMNDYCMALLHDPCGTTTAPAIPMSVLRCSDGLANSFYVAIHVYIARGIAILLLEMVIPKNGGSFRCACPNQQYST